MSTRALSKYIAVSLFVLCLLGVGVVAEAQTNVQDGVEVIDLRSWRDQRGRTLADVNQGHSMALVVLVSPNCDTCGKAKNSIESLRERAKKAGMGYYVLMIPDGTDTQKYFSYAASLKINAESFVWSNAGAKASPTLATMPVPSHVLLSTDRFEGRIVNKWNGVPEDVQAKFIRPSKNAIPNHYLVTLTDDVVSKTAPIDVRREQVRAIAEKFAQLHKGKVGFIYETALFGFSIELPNEAAAILISRNPRVRFVEQDGYGSWNAKNGKS
ncbi:MAG TPA: hypothetical protein VF290_26665 [Pyrinomonadaceae bacterium]